MTVVHLRIVDVAARGCDGLALQQIQLLSLFITYRARCRQRVQMIFEEGLLDELLARRISGCAPARGCSKRKCAQLFFYLMNRPWVAHATDITGDQLETGFLVGRAAGVIERYPAG